MIKANLTQENLNEVNMFVNNHLTTTLVEEGLSLPAIAFILQSVTEAVDNAQDQLDNS